MNAFAKVDFASSDGLKSIIDSNNIFVSKLLLCFFQPSNFMCNCKSDAYCCFGFIQTNDLKKKKNSILFRSFFYSPNLLLGTFPWM